MNALANEVTFEMGIDLPEPITAEHMEEAKERLVLARVTHVDSLTDKLSDPRVERLIDP